jgi:hypothetical protein
MCRQGNKFLEARYLQSQGFLSRYSDGRGSIPGRIKNVKILQTVQTGYGAHTASCTMDISESFRGTKAAGA